MLFSDNLVALELLQLMEVVLDLGRPPVARFPSGDMKLSEAPLAQSDLSAAVTMVSSPIHLSISLRLLYNLSDQVWSPEPETRLSDSRQLLPHSAAKQCSQTVQPKMPPYTLAK